MKILILSDIHGETEILDKLDEEFKAADMVLFAGDFAKFERTETALPALEKLCKKHDVIFSVIGNCDEPGFLAEIEARDVSVERALAMHEGLAIAGSGGGSKFTGTTPNERTDEELVSDFNIITEQGEQKWNNLVAIMHNPPKDTECDKIPNGVHVGSPLLKAFIEKYEPLLVATGHIHESAAVCNVGAATVINPGSLAEGKYAVAKVEKESGMWKVSSVELKSI